MMLAGLVSLSVAAGPAQDWQAQWQDEVQQVRRSSPALVAQVHALQPRRLRSGDLAFVDASLNQPGAACLIVARLRGAGEAAPVRVALARALGRTPDVNGRWIAGLLFGEADPQVRVALISALQRAEGPQVLAGLGGALTDPDPSAQAEAARVIGYRPDGAALGAELQEALSDRSSIVRASAARSLGWLRVEESWDALIPGLLDPDPEVRLQCLRALRRLGGSAGTLPQVRQLVLDPEPRVSRLAERMLSEP